MSKKEKDINELNDTVEETADLPENKPKKAFRKLKYGTASVIVICLVTAIVIVINLMVSMVSKRNPIKFDLTPDKRYELSDESIEVLKNLEKDVEITVTCQRSVFDGISAYYRSGGLDVPFDIIPEFLDKYAMYAEQGNGSISVKYVNLDQDPDIVARYNKYYSGEITDNSIIFYADERVKVIDSDSVFNMVRAVSQDPATGMPSFAFAGESDITSAIMSVADTNPISVAFVSSMSGQPVYNESEYASTAAALKNTLLGNNGYDCTDIDIALDELDTEAYDLVVIPMPSYDFNEDIIKKLSDFLYNGGKYGKNLIYIPAFTQTNLPNIADFLEDWSIRVEENIIIDDYYAIYDYTNIVLNIADSTLVGEIPNESLPLVSPYTKEVTILNKNNDDIVKAVLTSSGNAYTSSITNSGAGSEDRNVRNAAVISKKQRAENFNVYESNVLVLGSSDMLGATVLEQTNTYKNANVLLNIINTMTGKENSAVIPEKSIQQSYIAPTQNQLKWVKVLVIWIIPGLVAIIGIGILLRRRNR